MTGAHKSRESLQSTGLGFFFPLLPFFLCLLMFLTCTTQCVPNLRPLTLSFSSWPRCERPVMWRLSICFDFLANTGF